MIRPLSDTRASRLVQARLRMLLRHGYARILCGRETSPDRFDCGGDLGRVYALPLAGQEFNNLDLDLDDEDIAELVAELAESAPPHLLQNPEDLNDPVNYALTRVSDPDTPSGLLRLGLSGVTADDLVDLDSDTIGLWVAWHERGYTRLANGDYAVTNNPIPVQRSWRVDSEGRVSGPDRIPASLLRDVDQIEIEHSTGHASRSRAQGLVGARPVLPAVIVCPDAGCQTRNAVRRLNTGELPNEAKRSLEDQRRRRIEAAFERDHPLVPMGDEAHLPLAERERHLREWRRERRAAYQRWYRDDKCH